MGHDPASEKGPPGPIIDELLCFIMNKWSHMDVDTLIKLCVNTFDENEIEASKDILFNILRDETDSTALIKRRGSKVGDSKSLNNMRDMCQLLQEKGDVEIPRFVAHDLGKLPPIHFDHIDVTVLLNKIQNVNMAVKLLKEGMSEMCNTNESIHEKNTSFESRIEKLENYFKDLNICDDNNSNIVVENENKNEDANIEDCENVIDNKINELPLPCEECDLRFKSQNELSEHKVTIHELFKITEYHCNECKFVFTTMEGLRVTKMYIKYFRALNVSIRELLKQNLKYM